MIRPFTRIFQISVFALLFAQVLVAQTAKTAQIKGKIIEAQTKAPLAYAEVRILKSTDSTLITGGISDDKGQVLLQVPYGQYYAVVEFLGYQAIKISNLVLSAEKTTLDLGQISLSTSVLKFARSSCTGRKKQHGTHP